MSAITALTAQNTLGVAGILETAPEFLEQQLDCIFTDIRPDAVKIGMLCGADMIRAAAKKLREYHAVNIVLDPVMVSTSGSRLLSREAVEEMKARMFPLADLVTPNIPEGEVLTGMRIESPEDMEKAAETIACTYGCAVLLKGGHQAGSADDLLYRDGSFRWYPGRRIANPNNHGTGCTLSSAIASNLAKGFSMEEAVERAKKYISGALEAMLNLGRGNGPMDHGFDLRGEFIEEK